MLSWAPFEIPDSQLEGIQFYLLCHHHHLPLGLIIELLRYKLRKRYQLRASVDKSDPIWSYIVIYCYMSSYIVKYRHHHPSTQLDTKLSGMFKHFLAVLAFSGILCILISLKNTSTAEMLSSSPGVYFEWRIVCLRTRIITFHES